MYVHFYLFTRTALSGLDQSLEEAPASLGADRRAILRRVTLPLLRPALAGAGLLVFMTSLASFSAPYLFGGGLRVMTTQIVATGLNGDDRLAMVETAALLLLALWILPPAYLVRNLPVGGTRRRRQSRFCDRFRGLRDVEHAVHLRHPSGLARDPREPAPGRCRRRRVGVVLMSVSAAVFSLAGETRGATG